MTYRDPVSALRTGNLIVMVDDDASEGGAELWLAAESADPIVFATLVRHTSGYVSVAIPASRSSQLEAARQRCSTTTRPSETGDVGPFRL